jgi:hypothetical protein
MAIIFHMAQNMDEELPAPAQAAIDGPAPPIFVLSLLVAVPIADVATTHVALAAIVDCPTNAAPMAV